MGENRTSGLMSGGVETGPLKDTAPPLDSTYRANATSPNLLLPSGISVFTEFRPDMPELVRTSLDGVYREADATTPQRA